MTEGRTSTTGLVLFSVAFALVGCSGLDAETARAAICATQTCAWDVECPTGMLFRKGDNRLRYIEGDHDRGVHCKFALEQAGFARVEASQCDAGDHGPQPCVENTITPILSRSSFHSESYRGISAERLFLRCGVRRTRVVSVDREGERYLVRLDTVLESNEGFDSVRDCCIGPEVPEESRETSVYVCRTDGRWRVCGKFESGDVDANQAREER
jgi:hypothetical protein